MFESVPVEEVVSGLAVTDPGELTDQRVVDLLITAAAVGAWVESVGLAAVAELRRRRQRAHRELLEEQRAWPRPAGVEQPERDTAADEHEVDRFCAAEIGAALHLSQGAAMARVELAADLADRLPLTMAALSQGRIQPAHARKVHEAVTVLDDQGASFVEQEVLDQAPSQTPAQLGAAARRASIRVDAGAAAARCEAARAARRARCWDLDDGVAALQVTGPAETVAAAWARVDALARREQVRTQEVTGSADGRLSIDQARADVVLRMLAGSPDLLAEPAAGVGVVVDVVAPLATLLGLYDQPGELPGLGPLPAPVARALAAGGRWRWSGAGSEVAGSGPSAGRGAGATSTSCHHPLAGSYRPGEALAAVIRSRDTTCRFAGCRRRARACDVDHTVPHPQGPTARCNLACLCRLHHRTKHRAGWHVVQLAEGVLRWTSPTGHVYVTAPPRWGSPVVERSDGSDDPVP
jgi:hypothetical protein